MRTSAQEFDFVKRIQVTNEVPLVSPQGNLHSGLKNDFWQYLLGDAKVEYDTGDFYKNINGSYSSSYGPSGGTYHSLDISGALAPEYDLFLHEIYRYLDSLYPDHPDFLDLLTPIEINEALMAAAALIDYVPNYKFLSSWFDSEATENKDAESLKWKIRDLKSYAFRRKFSGAYLGYKLAFGSIARHGSVYLTGTYLPHKESGEIDASSPHALRYFRLIDFEGENDSVYYQPGYETFKGIVLPSDLGRIYDSVEVPSYLNTSSLTLLTPGGFLVENPEEFSETAPEPEESLLYAAGISPSLTIGSLGHIDVAGGNPSSIINYLTTSNLIHACTRRKYSIASSTPGMTLSLTPHPGIYGRFELSPVKDYVAIDEVPPAKYQEEQISSQVSQLYLDPTITLPTTGWNGAAALAAEDLIEDAISDTLYNKAQVISLTPPTFSLAYNPNFYSDGLQRYSISSIATTATPIFILKMPVQQTTDDILHGRENPYVLAQGHLIFGSSSKTGYFVIKSFLAEYNSGSGPTVPGVSEINTNDRVGPFYWDEDSRSDRLRIAKNQVFSLYQYVEGALSSAWTKVSTVDTGWITDLHYGYCDTQEHTRNSEVLTSLIDYSKETWATYVSQVSRDIYAQKVPLTYVDFYGKITEDSPTQITFDQTLNTSLNIDDLYIGASIRGPGIPTAAYIININENLLTLSESAKLFGSFAYSTTIKALPKDKESILSFKTEINTAYHDETKSIFDYLYPSALWPAVGAGYLEGFKDVSLFHYFTNALVHHPTREDPEFSLLDVAFTKNVVVELSLDRILTHQNSLSLKSGTSYLCLCDTPWLDYIESSVNSLKRSSESVSVGAQLNLTTDTSGFYVQSAGENYLYSDETTHVKFTAFPSLYNGDEEHPDSSIPTYVQVGTGGENKQYLFKSIADFIRPLIYGESVIYDQSRVLPTGYSVVDGKLVLDTAHYPTLQDALNATPLQEGDSYLLPGEKRRTTYYAPPSIGGEGAAIFNIANVEVATSGLALESPLFESPLGAWETPYNAASVDLPTNTFQIINVSIYPQEFKNVNLISQQPLILNSPAITELKRLPDKSTDETADFRYLGFWLPKLDPATSTVEYPSSTTAEVGDYYIISGTTKILDKYYYADDWLIWDGATWIVKMWLYQGPWPVAPGGGAGYLDPITPTFPDITELSNFNLGCYSTLDELLQVSYPYFTLSVDSADEPVTYGDFQIYNGDWLVLINVVGGVPQWHVSSGKCYQNLIIDVEQSRRIKNWYFEGTWDASSNTLPIYTDLDIPSGYTIPSFLREYALYYITSSPGTLGGKEVEKGDWIILTSYNELTHALTWDINVIHGKDLASDLIYPYEYKVWEFINTWSSTSVLPAISDFGYTANELRAAMSTKRFYFVVSLPEGTDSATLYPYVGAPESRGIDVVNGSWLILSTVSPLVFKVGNSQDALPLALSASGQPIITYELSAQNFATLTSRISTEIDSHETEYSLPRKFIAPGSSNFVFKIDPKFKFKNTAIDLTADAIYPDTENQQLYVGPVASGTLLDIVEPLYFKNLCPVSGIVYATKPSEIRLATGLALNAEYISIGDQAISLEPTKIRNNYLASEEIKFFTNYKTIPVQVNSGDRKILNPIEVSYSESYSDKLTTDFLATAQALSTGDALVKANAIELRSWNSSLENKYYKNLAAALVSINKTEGNILRPAGASSEDIQAFTTLTQKLSAGDTVKELYLLSGFSSSTVASLFTGNINAIKYYEGVWVAGSTTGELKRSTNGTAWSSVTLPSIGTSSVNAIGAYTHTISSVSRVVWFAACNDGKLYNSIDNGVTWVRNTSAGIIFGSSHILSLTASASSWVASGNAGILAYSTDINNYFNSWSAGQLPYTGNVPGPSPTNVGWYTDPVRAVKYGADGNWLAGGGVALSEVAEGYYAGGGALLARASSPSSTWSFIYLPDEWDDATETYEYMGSAYSRSRYVVNSVEYGNGTWVVGGTGGKLSYSYQPTSSWYMCTLPYQWAGADINTVTYINGIWFILGTAGKIAKSYDGVTFEMVETSALGAISLRALASNEEVYKLGGSSTNIATFSNTNEVLSLTSVLGIGTSADPLAIQINNSIIPESEWGSEESKEILITFDTKKSIDDILIGIPTSKLERYLDANNDLYLETKYETSDYRIANRVYFPRLDPNVTLTSIEGYPTYAENSALYHSSDFINKMRDKIYLCSSAGDYVDESWNPLDPTDFYLLQVPSVTGENPTYTRLDIRQTVKEPIYKLYASWLDENTSAITQITDTTVAVSTLTVASMDLTANPPSITLSGNIPSGEDVLWLKVYTENDATIINPATIAYTNTDGTYVSGFVTNPDGSKYTTITDKTNYWVPSEISGVYFSSKGYGSLLTAETTYQVATLTVTHECTANGTVAVTLPGEDAIAIAITTSYNTSTLVAEKIQSADYSSTGWVATVNGSVVTFTKTTSGSIAGSLVFSPASTGITATAVTTIESLPWEVSPEDFEIGTTRIKNTESHAIYLTDSEGNFLTTASNKIEVSAPKFFNWAMLLATHGKQITATATEYTSRPSVHSALANRIQFDSDLTTFAAGETFKYVKLRMLTALTRRAADTLNDSSLIYNISKKERETFGQDRACMYLSDYPSILTRPELYETEKYFTNNTDDLVYLCNESGQYVDELLSPITENFVTLPMPKYKTCYEWYMTAFYVDGVSNENPYWQYLVIKDTLDATHKEWTQSVKLYRKRKLATTGYSYEEVPENERYFNLTSGMEYKTDGTTFIVNPVDYIQYKSGKVSGIFISNPYYDKSLNPEVDSAIMTFGLPPTTQFSNITNIFSEDTVIANNTRFNVDMAASYVVNSLKNFANPSDKRSSIVGISELGIFNKYDNMIAYATFPPIIYDSSKHHVSFNIFIKQDPILRVGD